MKSIESDFTPSDNNLTPSDNNLTLTDNNLTHPDNNSTPSDNNSTLTDKENLTTEGTMMRIDAETFDKVAHGTATDTAKMGLESGIIITEQKRAYAKKRKLWE